MCRRHKLYNKILATFTSCTSTALVNSGFFNKKMKNQILKNQNEFMNAKEIKVKPIPKNTKFFDYIGFHIDYMLNGKYIGSLSVNEPDREIFGYNGKLNYIPKEDIKLINNKKLKKGLNYISILYPLCGKIIIK